MLMMIKERSVQREIFYFIRFGVTSMTAYISALHTYQHGNVLFQVSITATK